MADARGPCASIPSGRSSPAMAMPRRTRRVTSRAWPTRCATIRATRIIAAGGETTWRESHMRKLGLSLMLAISLGAATGAFAQSGAPPADPAWKAAEVVEFIGLKKGDRVADIVAGRLTASLALAVGPSGKVYAIETAEVVKAHPEVLGQMKGLASQMPNVIVSAEPVATPLPSGLDAVFIRQN